MTARVMRKYGIYSIHKNKFKVTTDSKHSYPVSENVLNVILRRIESLKSGFLTLTYIHTKEGWLYLAVVIDLFDRKVIEWSYSSGMTAQETVIPVWRMAVRNRPIRNELIFHSDRGVQNACKAFIMLLKNSLITQSISRK